MSSDIVIENSVIETPEVIEKLMNLAISINGDRVSPDENTITDIKSESINIDKNGININVTVEDCTIIVKVNVEKEQKIPTAVKLVNPVIKNIIDTALQYFQNYEETHKYKSDDDEDEGPGSNIYVHRMPYTHVLDIKNKNGIKLRSIKIENFDMYSIELRMQNPYYMLEAYHSSDHILHEYKLTKEQLPEVLQKMLGDFQKIKKCSQCLDLNFNPTENDICVNCCFRIALEYPKIQCAICLEETHSYITLPCGHQFHGPCFTDITSNYIHKINQSVRKCPLCRVLVSVERDHHDVSFRKIVVENES
jgi:hypothetical protein